MSSPPRLASQRIVVTGAGQGLGREFALHLAGLGARVLATDLRAERLRETRAIAQHRSLELFESVTDVSSARQAAELANATSELLGGLDALVNNAAVVEGLRRRAFDEIGEQ